MTAVISGAPGGGRDLRAPLILPTPARETAMTISASSRAPAKGSASAGRAATGSSLGGPRDGAPERSPHRRCERYARLDGGCHGLRLK